jgi:2-dehydro-3-deoxyglucarate aldolase/4-hydroxy-2-oxoheptanedioate aldolase
MRSLIRQRLAAGKIVRTTYLTVFTSPKLVECIGISGKFHGAWIDQEHAGVSHSDLERMLIACRAAGVDAFARVPLVDYASVMRPLEAGCSGVMIAQVRSMQEVEQAISWAKFPPEGIRGVFGGNIEARFGAVDLPTYITESNRERWVAIQIETAEAADIVDEIAATKGVDMLFLGPADLSVTLGVPGDVLHPKCVAVMERVGAACKKYGKHWGTLSRSAEHAQKAREHGCQLFSVFGDLDIVSAGLNALEQKFASLMAD